MLKFDDLKKDLSGLVPVIVQDEATYEVLMLGYQNEEAFNKTLATGLVHFYSRERKKLWLKGETSGNYLRVKAMYTDCDADALLILAQPQGPTCHTGKKSCFFNKIMESGFPKGGFLYYLEDLLRQRKKVNKEGSYTSKLFLEGKDRILKKVAEEAGEFIIASKNKDRREIAYEGADLVFHLMMALVEEDMGLVDIIDELISRRKG
ncbi:phosphoribosyl-ATP pyrophosphatase /phosphoribosyl-AMP cyclohydrolase [Caldanaerovirga acetigignens]|uniref:Histidine biosynthesis bifunctional protein HisIE n=1 Tax=Caldanaerovirga acetigignens TaxID=447595 RepID=A0A1M7M2T1_9FIRM|nr:bifunctional phosphoribosyl-AMP cyclohydrolase/phosphoribosyl-ATP diphosphatase HisIE [Caldanaerovirga acetigignens]SHM84984.1 phosphoribosyl-ATP pyrophosphatase /phosphoribosyl-AMP cyclohydrolase [Caldanaerovirga acetigignens]